MCLTIKTACLLLSVFCLAKGIQAEESKDALSQEQVELDWAPLTSNLFFKAFDNQEIITKELRWLRQDFQTRDSVVGRSRYLHILAKSSFNTLMELEEEANLNQAYEAEVLSDLESMADSFLEQKYGDSEIFTVLNYAEDVHDQVFGKFMTHSLESQISEGDGPEEDRTDL